jgi:hypothetical protein
MVLDEASRLIGRAEPSPKGTVHPRVVNARIDLTSGSRAVDYAKHRGRCVQISACRCAVERVGAAWSSA